MRVNFATKTAFGAALSTRATSELEKVTDEAKRVLYANQDYMILKILRTAFDNFQNDHQDNSDPLRKEFEQYKKENPLVENYDRIALYPIVAKSEPDLFKNFKDDPEKQKSFQN